MADKKPPPKHVNALIEKHTKAKLRKIKPTVLPEATLWDRIRRRKK